MSSTSSSSSSTLAPGAVPTATFAAFPPLSTRVALITGANQGIGLEVVKQLATNPHLIVLLGARTEEKARKAAADIGWSNVQPLVIDIDDRKSIVAAAEEVKSKYGGLDILMNNAAIARDPAHPDGSTTKEQAGKQAEVVLHTNYWGVKHTCEVFFPLLRAGARVVNVSSELSRFMYKYLPAKIADPFFLDGASIENIEAGLAAYIKACYDGNRTELGYQLDNEDKGEYGTYSFSKLALSGLTRIQARENKLPGVVINACCPGYTATNLNKHRGTKTPADGARTLVYAALLPADAPSGVFYSEMRPQEWIRPDMVKATA